MKRLLTTFSRVLKNNVIDVQSGQAGRRTSGRNFFGLFMSIKDFPRRVDARKANYSSKVGVPPADT